MRDQPGHINCFLTTKIAKIQLPSTITDIKFANFKVSGFDVMFFMLVRTLDNCLDKENQPLKS